MEQLRNPGVVRRRLSDRIEDAFEQACKQGHAEVAACLLQGLDLCLLGQPTGWERRQTALAVLRACAQRLSLLRTAQAAEQESHEPHHGAFPAGRPVMLAEQPHTIV